MNGYTGVPSVSPSGSDVPQQYQRIDVDARAFGAGVGQSLQQLGGDISKAGDVLYENTLKQQAILNDTENRDRVTDTMIKGGQIAADYHAKEGLDAVNSFPKYQTDMKELVQKTAEGISNPAAKKMYLDQMTRQTGVWLNSGATWSAAQNRAASNQSAQSSIALAQNNAGQFADNDKAFADSVASIQSSVKSQATVHGWDENTTKLATDQEVSKAWMFRFSSLAQADPAKAKQMYDDHKFEMTPQDELTAYKTIEAGLNARTSRTVADSVSNMGDSPDGVASKGYYERLKDHESGGKNIPADERSSSAYGLYQFTTGTWDNLLKNHPELGLTSKDRYTEEGQEKAIQAFTADNAAHLRKSGVPVNDQTLYLAHFMGAQGAEVFYNAMRSNPTESAAAAFPKEAAANHGVFYNKDGSARTLAQVFQVQTGKFGKPMTLEERQALAKQQVNKIDPGNATLEDNTISRVTTQWNQEQQAANIQYQSNRSNVYDAISADGDYRNQPHSLADIQNNPTLNTAYNALKPEDQIKMVKLIETQQKAHDARDPDQADLDRVNQYKGLSVLSPEKMAKVDLSDYQDLPKAQRNMVETMVRDANAKVNQPSKAAPDKNLSQNVLASIMAPGSDVHNWLTNTFPGERDGTFQRGAPQVQRFVGAMQDWADAYAAQNGGKMPSQEEAVAQASKMIVQSHTQVYDGWWSTHMPGILGGGPTVVNGPYKFEQYVPSTEVAKIQSARTRAGLPPANQTELFQYYKMGQKGVGEGNKGLEP
jgi:hypothetical protein